MPRHAQDSRHHQKLERGKKFSPGKDDPVDFNFRFQPPDFQPPELSERHISVV